MDPSIAWKAPLTFSFSGLGLYGPSGGLFLVAALVGAAGRSMKLGTPATTKPFDSIPSFYPFYLTQHTERFTKVLHVLGTGCTLAAVAKQPRLGVALLAAVAGGSAASPYFRRFESGAGEAFFAVTAYVACGRSLGVPAVYLAGAPATAYFFAWISHAFFEKNKPATFIYPTYSLLCDFLMCADIFCGRVHL